MIKRREIFAKTVLTKTGIAGFDHCINPYVGCEHGCRYCYAGFMKRFTGHVEPWGEFLDVKVNAPQVLRRQLRNARRGTVIVGTVTDPYQPAEKHYRITRGCLEALLEHQFPVDILTRSSLCLRDAELFRAFDDITVGLSVTTDDEEIKGIFEPHSPSIRSRIEALKGLHLCRIKTYAFIGPMLPMNPQKLAEKLEDAVDEVLIDRLNYGNKVKAIYRRESLEHYFQDNYFISTADTLKRHFEKRGILVSVIF